MNYQKSQAQLMRGLSNAKSIAVIVAALYGAYLLKKMYNKGDEIAKVATQPAGQLLSDVDAYLGGWSPVELTPLKLQPWYFDNSYRLTPDAEKVIKKAYPAEYAYFFNGNVLKPEYRNKIGFVVVAGVTQ